MKPTQTPKTDREYAQIYTGVYIPANKDGTPDKVRARKLVQLQIRRKISTFDLSEHTIQEVACQCIGDILEAHLGCYSLSNGETIIDRRTGEEVVVESLSKKELRKLENLLYSSGIDKVEG